MPILVQRAGGGQVGPAIRTDSRGKGVLTAAKGHTPPNYGFREGQVQAAVWRKQAAAEGSQL